MDTGRSRIAVQARTEQAVRALTPKASSPARTELALLLTEYGLGAGDAQAIAGCAEGAGLLRA